MRATPPKTVDPVRFGLIQPRPGATMDNGCENRQDDIVWDFSWSPVEGATQYHLYVIGANAVIPVIDNAMIPGTVFHYVNPKNFIPAGDRFGWTWKVRALVNGVWSDWSAKRSFNVEPLNADCSGLDQGKPDLPAPDPSVLN